MKYLLKVSFLMAVLIFPCLVKSQGTLCIEGNIATSMDGKIITLTAIYPHPTTLPRPRIFQSIIKDGKFSFNAPVNGLEFYVIGLNHNETKFSTAFQLMPTHTQINFLDTCLKTYEITGNDVHKEYLAMLKEREAIKVDSRDYMLSWIKAHPNSPLNNQFLFGLRKELPESEIEQIFNRIPDEHKSNSWGKEIKFTIENLHVGRHAPDFSQTDTVGKRITLSDFRGKYVLIDFWASWCVPCRAENPTLVKAYEIYSKKGLEIIGVSLDDDRSSWVKAIKSDHLPWLHVSDLKEWQNEVSKNYRINSIPANFLIDPQGKIIAKNLRGDNVLKVLGELIK